MKLCVLKQLLYLGLIWPQGIWLKEKQPINLYCKETTLVATLKKKREKKKGIIFNNYVI